MLINIVIFLSSLFLLVGCATKAPSQPEFPQPVEQPVGKTEQDIVIDVAGLERTLKFERSLSDVGYAEKSFNTCTAGHGYSSNRDCRQEFFVSINFQLLCRDADESQVAFESAKMQPLNGRTLFWSLGNSNEKIFLDNQGYGQIRKTYKKSQRHQRLRLKVNNEILYVRAGEMNRVITPPVWCQ